MFTGIIESKAQIMHIEKEGTNVHFTLQSELANLFKVDQSVAHDGVCMTVTSVKEQTYTVTAILETMNRTNLSDRKIGDWLNIERCMLSGGRFDGHMVQGHVDTTAICTQRKAEDGSYVFLFELDTTTYAGLMVEKGSICINGVSLTLVSCGLNTFSVAIIPYTYAFTNFGTLQEGMRVNIEFDIIGKYILKNQQISRLLDLSKS